MNDLVHLAAERAAHRFGERGDGVFNAAGFSSAFTELAGTRTPIDGKVVRAMLTGRSDIRVLRGGAHYRLIKRGVS